jgi:signal transduction histidine kinase
MADRLIESTGDFPSRSSSPTVRFAALLERHYSLILESYQEIMTRSAGPNTWYPGDRDQAAAKIIEILDEVRDNVRGSAGKGSDGYGADPGRPAAGQLAAGVACACAETLFKVTVRTLIRHVEDDPELLPPFFVAITSLNEISGRLIKDSALVYANSLLGHIQQAQLHERLRIARELHDHLGEGISAALRQIELHEINADAALLPDPALHTMLAKLALRETMAKLRIVIFDLRRDPVTSLSKEINEYIASAASEAEVRLRLTGDENKIPSVVIGEVFLIIREALRNALTHSAPRLVLINIGIMPNKLEVYVEDDGCGFDLQDLEAKGSSTLGLATMRERAALIGGVLAVSSSHGRGTRVSLQVPLTAALPN